MFLQRGDVIVGQEAAGGAVYHEGFFWKCSVGGSVGDGDLLWKFWFSKRDTLACCFPHGCNGIFIELEDTWQVKKNKNIASGRFIIGGDIQTNQMRKKTPTERSWKEQNLS